MTLSLLLSVVLTISTDSQACPNPDIHPRTLGGQKVLPTLWISAFHKDNSGIVWSGKSDAPSEQGFIRAEPETNGVRQYLGANMLGAPWETGWFFALVGVFSLLLAACILWTTRKSKIASSHLQEKINSSEETMQLLLNSTSEAFFGTDNAGKCIFSNPACDKLFKIPESESMLGKDMHRYFAPISERCDLLEFASSGDIAEMDLNAPSAESYTMFKSEDGTSFPVSYSVQPLLKESQKNGAVVRFVDATVSLTNIRARRRHQCMEILGQFVDGIAHDFNNHLSVVRVCLETLELQHPDSMELKSSVNRMLESVNSAASLSNKLVALSNTHELFAHPVNLNQAVEKLQPLIESTLGERIEFHLNLSKNDLFCLVDEEQLRNSILNLVTNARDAVEESRAKKDKIGRVKLSTSNIGLPALIEKGHVPEHNSTHEHFVALQVEDTGIGLADDFREQIFAPFYSTKSISKGAGLGLAIVSSFVQQSNGHIEAVGHKNRGSTFSMYFPRISPNRTSPGIELTSDSPDPKMMGNGENILLVEDYEANLFAIRDFLSCYNYNVFCAKDVREARLLFEKIEKLDCLISDVVLPSKMDGRDLFKEFVAKRPQLKAIFISGYAKKRNMQGLENVPWLKKPIDPKLLLKKLHNIVSEETATH